MFGVKVKNEARKVESDFLKHGISMPFPVICQIVKDAKRHCKIQERWCCEQMDDETTAKVERQESAIEARIKALVEEYGLTANFDGDPRGFTVKLHSPSGDLWNTWGGKETGYGVGENA